jgi:hypothetical protein
MVGGVASLAGSLNASSVNNFSPAFGASYQLLTYASSSGAFTTTNLIVAGKTLVPTYNLHDLTLTAPPLIVTNTNDSGAGSLRAAINAVNADTSGSATHPEVITFAISSGAQTILLSSALTLTNPVVMDGTSQPGSSGVPLITISGNRTNQIFINNSSATVKFLTFDQGSAAALAAAATSTTRAT